MTQHHRVFRIGVDMWSYVDFHISNSGRNHLFLRVPLPVSAAAVFLPTRKDISHRPIFTEMGNDATERSTYILSTTGIPIWGLLFLDCISSTVGEAWGF